MPKVTGTKKLRAAELLDRATTGPSLDLTFSSARLTAEQKQILAAELEATYRQWSKSWLLPELKRLVPELRHLSDGGN